jgi:chromate transport protein ChrA
MTYTTINDITTSAYIADLSGVWSALVQHYIGPAIIIITGFFAVMYLVKREIRPMLVFLALAVIVAVVVYAAPALLGQNSTLVRNGGEIAKEIN